MDYTSNNWIQFQILILFIIKADYSFIRKVARELRRFWKLEDAESAHPKRPIKGDGR